MEHFEAISVGQCNNNCNGMFSSSSNEGADFMAQLLGNCSLPSASTLATTAWHVPESNGDIAMAAYVHQMDNSSMMFSPNEGENHNAATNNNMYYYFSQGSNASGTSSDPLLPSSYNHEGYYHHTVSDERQSFGAPYTTSITSMSMTDYFVVENNNTNYYLVGDGDDNLNQQDIRSEDIMDYSNEDNQVVDQNVIDGVVDLQLGREQNIHISSSADLDKKRPRNIIVNAEKNKRIVKPRKNQKHTSRDGDYEGEKNKAIFQRQDSTLSRTSFEVDSNVCQDMKRGATSRSSCPNKGNGIVSLGGKTRASRGAATDPQSLYARKRRERINERLKILQTLVPNGTKVDISTMLEEAVEYVKFLQLQIKLLSSDDTWMYAPIAYNGMDLGLQRNIDTSTT